MAKSVWLFPVNRVNKPIDRHLPVRSTAARPRCDRHAGARRGLRNGGDVAVPGGARGEGYGSGRFVEDDPAVNQFAYEVLDEYGYNAICASNGAQALNLVKEATEKIDLLITDLIMPEMNGKELAEKLSAISPKILRNTTALLHLRW